MAKDHLEEIMDAAVVLFINRGFHMTKIKDIAEKAGIATGSVYKYFQSKEDIWEMIPMTLVDEDHLYSMKNNYPVKLPNKKEQYQLIFDKFQQIDQTLKQEIFSEASKLSSVIGLLVKTMDQYGSYFLLIEKNQEVDEILTDYYREYRKQLFSYVSQFFLREIESKRIRKMPHLTYHVELIIDSISQLTMHKRYDSFELKKNDLSLITNVLEEAFGHAYLIEH